MRKTTLTATLGLALSFTLGCNEATSVFTDERDSKTYKMVKIGTQTWMAENLNYEANGSKCYKNDLANCNKYGRLYDWETAMKACLKGWHLPSDEEWDTLMTVVGGEETAGKFLKATNGWNDNDGKSSNGTDKFGFSALPGGIGTSAGSFRKLGSHGDWWSASEDDSTASSMEMGLNNDVYRYGNDKSLLHSVRCLKD